MTFLGIDIGTVAVRAVLVDEHDAVLAEAAIPIATVYPEPGRAEQDPEEWWRAAQAAIDAVRHEDAEGFSGLRGIGLSGQMQATVLLDAAHVPILPAMTWNDARAFAECALLERQVPDFEVIAGAPAAPTFTAPRLLWLREHELAQFERIAHVLSAKDYVRLRLTGECATDVSDAAGTLLFAEEQRTWSGAMIAAAGIPRDVLPSALEGPAWSGMVRPEILAEWGIGHQVVVAAGAADIAAAAIGVGAIRDGDALVSLGAGAQVLVSREGYRRQVNAGGNTFAHGLPGRWFETSAPFNATLCLEWMTRMLGEGDIGRLVSRAQESFAGPSPLLFLPYLAGESAPFNDPEARGAFSGVDESTGQREMTQAVLEGIVLSLKEAEDGFGGRFPAGAIPLVGEGARSALWLLIAASVLDRPLLRLSNADIAAAFGAARLGRMAATAESADVVCVQPPLIEIVDPVPQLHAAYESRRDDFRAFAQSLRQAGEAGSAPAAKRRRARR